MKLKIENKEELNVDKFEIVKKALKSLRSYGPNSYAILTDGFGNYIQVGGGLFTCFVEKYDVCEKKIYRAIHEKSATNFEDGSVLIFGGGTVKLNKNNWFNIEEATVLFNKFFIKEDYPSDINWEPLDKIL